MWSAIEVYSIEPYSTGTPYKYPMIAKSGTEAGSGCEGLGNVGPLFRKCEQQHTQPGKAKVECRDVRHPAGIGRLREIFEQELVYPQISVEKILGQ